MTGESFFNVHVKVDRKTCNDWVENRMLTENGRNFTLELNKVNQIEYTPTGEISYDGNNFFCKIFLHDLLYFHSLLQQIY